MYKQWLPKLKYVFIILLLLNISTSAQRGGIGVKISSPIYHFANHPDYNSNLNSLYLSIRLSQRMTLFIDSYLFRANAEAFDTGLVPPMEKSTFTDRATVLGPIYHLDLNFYDLVLYGGLGFGWHSLLIGDKNRDIKESSKNYGGHAVLGLSYDIQQIPVIAFVEGRYARIFLTNESADPKFTPSALHRAGSIPLTMLTVGILVYFF